MRRLLRALSSVVVLAAVVASHTEPIQAQSRQGPPIGRPMTNGDVVALCRGKSGDKAAVKAIRTATTRHFDVSPAAVADLTRAGVPVGVIREMQRSARYQQVPPALLSARTAFLVDETRSPAGQSNVKTLRSTLRSWDHFAIVSDAKRADVVFRLATVANAGRNRPDVSMTVHQRATGTILWANTDSTVPGIVARLRQDLPQGPTLCVVFWCR